MANGKGTYPFSDKELEHFKNMLLEKRFQILQDIAQIDQQAHRKSAKGDETGDLSAVPIHLADIGSDTFEQELTLTASESERQLITEIDEAMERVEEGTYGLCLGTGKPIKKSRLEAMPWTKYSVEYAQQIQQS